MDVDAVSTPTVADAERWFDLMPRRELLDANFDGYKLSLEPFAHYTLDLGGAHKLNTRTFTDSSSSSSSSSSKIILYQHLKLFGMQNLLVVDPSDDARLYYFDEQRRLVRIVYRASEANMPDVRALVPTSLSLDDGEDLAPRMLFVSATRALVHDGHASLYLCERRATTTTTTASNEAEDWSIVSKWRDTQLDRLGCILKDAVLANDNATLHVLLANVNEPNASSSTSSSTTTTKFETCFYLLTFDVSQQQAAFCSLQRTRTLNCYQSVPDYVALERTESGNCLKSVSK